MFDTTIAHVNYHRVTRDANQHITYNPMQMISTNKLLHICCAMFPDVLPRNNIIAVIFQSLLAIIQEQIIYMGMLEVS